MEHQDVWYPVKNYEEYYELMKSGVVRSLSKRNFHNLISQRVDRGGYLSIRLSKQGKTKTYWVHRLLAGQFLPNPTGRKFVNHKNGNKLDNSLENLEWVTHQENVCHAYALGLCDNTKGGKHPNAKKVVDVRNGIVYDTITEASITTGINYSTCRNYLSGRTLGSYLKLAS